MSGAATMTAVLADTGDAAVPPQWRDSARTRVDGRPVRFGLATVPRIGFAADADYNRDHALVRVTAFGLTDRDVATLPDDGRRLAGAGRGVGSRFVGEVVATGTAVRTLRTGDRVVPCAEWPPPPDGGADGLATLTASRRYLRLPAAALFAVPPDMPSRVAAAVAVTGQAAFAVVRRLAPAAGDSALVCDAHTAHGSALVSALVAQGVRVLALMPFPREIEGVDEVVDSLGHDARRYARAVKGLDVVVDPGGTTHLAAAIPLLGLGGRYVVCGDSGRASDADWNAVQHSLVRKHVSVVGHHLGTRVDLAGAVGAWQRGDWSPPTEPAFDPGDLAGFVAHACSVERPGLGLFHLTDGSGPTDGKD
jgi:NADPH:quinone reductase-like Zn-dependent oxidoreductase